MEAQRLSKLIGLVYDSAQNLELWPLLLQALAEELRGGSGDALAFPQVESIEKLGDYVSHWYESPLDESLLEQTATQTVHFTGKEHELIQMVLPHLLRALHINRSLRDMSVKNEALGSVLEHLPIGMVVTDLDGRVYAKNHRFDEQLSGDTMLRIRAGRLQVSTPELDKQLSSMIREIAESPSNTVQSRALRIDGQKPVSLMLLPLASAEETVTTPKVIIFVASNASQVEIEPKSLQTLYRLSKAESRLTLALVNGQSLDEISEQYHVSKHTLRTQLKSIYSKMDCCRQAELVVKVLTSPAILSSHRKNEDECPLVLEYTRLDENERHNQKMFLSDGRCLSFAEYGAEDGYPVVMVHGLNGSRFQVHSDEEILRRNGIRLYIPERPGFGESDRLHERRIIDWPVILSNSWIFLG
ncbi:MAG: LuxR C-terminal-related transcriptional regulator [Gammaproteobacteria bacterium]|nr:LuxR C-terminal-related transcriptional regulator [Gammaproteobacteria bacterium]